MTVAKSLPSYVESTAPRNSCGKRSTIFAVVVEVSVVVKKHQIMIQVSACLLASMPSVDYVNRSFRRHLHSPYNEDIHVYVFVVPQGKACLDAQTWDLCLIHLMSSENSNEDAIVWLEYHMVNFSTTILLVDTGC